MSTAGLVLGILAIATSFIYIGLVAGILGVIFSALARKKEKSGMATAGLVCSIVGICISIIVIAGTAGAPKSGTKTGNSQDQQVTSDVTNASNQQTDKQATTKKPADLAEQMVTTLYTGKSSYFDSGYITLYVKNTADVDVSINVNFTEKDTSGNAIGSSSAHETCVAAGQDVLLTGYFDTFEDDATFEYSMKVDKSNHKSMHDAIELTTNTTEDGLVVTATNNSEQDVYWLEVQVVFLKGNSIVQTDFTYLMNDDDTLNPGQTLSYQTISTSDLDYDTVLYTYTVQDEDF